MINSIEDLKNLEYPLFSGSFSHHHLSTMYTAIKEDDAEFFKDTGVTDVLVLAYLIEFSSDYYKSRTLNEFTRHNNQREVISFNLDRTEYLPLTERAKALDNPIAYLKDLLNDVFKDLSELPELIEGCYDVEDIDSLNDGTNALYHVLLSKLDIINEL